MRVGICFDTGCSGRFAGIIRRSIHGARHRVIFNAYMYIEEMMQRCFASNPVWSSFRRYSTKKPFIHKKFSDYILPFPSTIHKTTGRSVTIRRLFQSFEIFVIVVRGLYPYY